MSATAWRCGATYRGAERSGQVKQRRTETRKVASGQIETYSGTERSGQVKQRRIQTGKVQSSQIETYRGKKESGQVKQRPQWSN